MNHVLMELYADLLVMERDLALILVKMFNVALMLVVKLLIDDLNVPVYTLEWMVIHLIYNMDAFHLFVVMIQAVLRMKFAPEFLIAKNTLYTNVKMFVVGLNVALMLYVVVFLIKQVAPADLTSKVILMIHELDVNLTSLLVLMIHLALIMKLVEDVTMDFEIVHLFVKMLDVALMLIVLVEIIYLHVNVYLVTLVMLLMDVKSHLNICVTKMVNVN